MSNCSDVTEQIIQAVIQVHQVLGPGFLESVYQKALVVELTKRDIFLECEKEVAIHYESEPIGKHRLDLIVAGQVVVELKTVEKLAGIHYAQLRSYLKVTGLRVGLLVNFATEKADYRRVELN